MRKFARPICEVGPLIVFFLMTNLCDKVMGYCADPENKIFVGTTAFVIATALALPTLWLLERRIPMMPLIGGFFVLIFGGLTLYLHDEIYIKVKPTIVNTLFACTLATGLLFGRNFLKILLDYALHLDHDGWRKLTWRWTGFFFLLAGINEIVWRSASTEFWAAFKLFGIMPLTIAFTMLQIPLIKRHWEGVNNPFARAPADGSVERPLEGDRR